MTHAISGSGIVTALQNLLVSDDTRYKGLVGGAKAQVEEAVAGVNSANREFAVGLLAECIRRETGVPETDLPGITQAVNAFADAQVLAGHAKVRSSETGNAVTRFVEVLEEYAGSFYQGGLKTFTHAGKEEGLNTIFRFALDLLKKDGFENPFPTEDELKTAVVEKIKESA
ncbi:MAG: hypothetical protein HYR97_01005 [Candidatus Melainabacteria bacterium]|nr:hypothetical protein [Candidatus Melainabacteria bacterium]MBI3308418.1 hypothetical protein [Candidatus Melainabacteria bacterium]